MATVPVETGLVGNAPHVGESDQPIFARDAIFGVDASVSDCDERDLIYAEGRSIAGYADDVEAGFEILRLR